MNWLINLSRRNRNGIGIGIGFLVTNTCSKSINSECGIHSTRLLQLLLRLPSPPPPPLFLPLLPALIDALNGHAHWHLSYSTGPFSHGMHSVAGEPYLGWVGKLEGRSRCNGMEGGWGGLCLAVAFQLFNYDFSIFVLSSECFVSLFIYCLPPASCLVPPA